ncbi:uncharacterized protein LOC110734886 [Chenopodium quinoa]|uniref:uncharacterized protein LOC110734886 n=1 Tax=Chenopodium quinoa TaxID=63459 RepID=UPI000B78CAF6|nr:uncharacterized protein LOC110734886 [Chenopodium quinoa]
MAGGDDEQPKQPPPPTSNDYHPANAISNVKNEVPEILDRDKGNYGSWVELFEIHCHSCNVIDHINPKSPRPTDLTTVQWNRLDSIVKKWIYNTISADLRSTLEGQKRDAFHQSKADTVPHALKVRLPRNIKDLGPPQVWLVYRAVSAVGDDRGRARTTNDGVAQSVTQIRPLPGFDEARSRILLEESQKSAKDYFGQAFVTQTNNTTITTATTTQQQQGRVGDGSGRGNKGRGGKPKGKGRGRGQSH